VSGLETFGDTDFRIRNHRSPLFERTIYFPGKQTSNRWKKVTPEALKEAGQLSRPTKQAN